MVFSIYPHQLSDDTFNVIGKRESSVFPLYFGLTPNILIWILPTVPKQTVWIALGELIVSPTLIQTRDHLPISPYCITHSWPSIERKSLPLIGCWRKFLPYSHVNHLCPEWLLNSRGPCLSVQMVWHQCCSLDPLHPLLAIQYLKNGSRVYYKVVWRHMYIHVCTSRP